jgi:A/G-specific adenine glycosylase
MQNFSPLIIEWYRQNKRDLPWRNTKDPYKIWLSEIILQQTRVDQGLEYYNKFISHYPTVKDLAKATEQDVLNDWQGLGYYSRARNLHYSAKYIAEELHGEFPKSYEQILKLKGVGKYTAAAIASFAFGECKAVVDGNVFRLLSRYFNIDTPIDSTKGQKDFQELADTIISKQNPATHNQAIMEMGAVVCKPKQPKCTLCPLAENCIAFEENIVLERPVKKTKTKIRNRYFHYLIYLQNDKTWLQKRTKKDIWQNMYQFPLVELENGESTPTMPAPLHVSEPIVHKLSHQHIHATFYIIRGFPEQSFPNTLEIKQSSIQDYPIPRIIDRYLEMNTFDF